MKKIIALSSLAVLYCLLCSQYTAPNGQVYTNECYVTHEESGSDFVSASAYYNDPDGNCKSDDFYIWFDFGPDNEVEGDQNWWDNYNGSNGGTEFDFNDWQCCHPGSGGNSDNCKWIYQPETNTIKIDCDSKGN